jgi:DNA-binding MarR family transcriptional regulator/N-acetylglutamate synthase-like GNAT family acetyltransferase
MTDLVPRIREFNRSWTEVLGLLDRGLLGTEHSLPEARVLFELGRRDPWERSDLRERLAIDDSFLTRVLASLERRGLVRSEPSARDGRRRQVRLTDAGRVAADELDSRSSTQIDGWLTRLTEAERQTLAGAITTVDHLVGPRRERSVTIRGLRSGDLGWIVQRHGELYATEYAWDDTFEALVARVVADFAARSRPDRESAWIAEVDGVRAGCVLCCEAAEHTAQLRTLLVEPWARGLGIGARLVDECLSFARSARYESVVLWTNDVLVSARRIYEAAGFRLVDEERHHSFGHDLVGQVWRLDLSGEVLAEDVASGGSRSWEG